MTTLNSMRHTAIHDPEQYKDKLVVVVGVGTIGSHLAHILARMQVSLVIYDHDTVEEHNLATQTYGAQDIGLNKVEAVEKQVLSIGPDLSIMAVPQEYPGSDDIVGDLIVSCVDSLNARRAIAQALVDKEVTLPIVDGRVGREQVEVYYFPSAKEWLAQLPRRGDVDPCGARFTAYTANVAAGLMANNVKRSLMGQKVPGRIIYDAATSIFIKED